ncbi:RmuC domain protein [Subdoligranulum variabile DSM 15176]|uniref:RmuC domain protein n=2 Tax=Subdoligranulum variabile TaxID=214851 RepID=D1PNL6_9FIRM|nr:RmuC domain protein [Subdoligranulum variabile DSM 15176]
MVYFAQGRRKDYKLMEWILYLLLALALLGDVLLAVLLVRSGRKPPKGDTADDFVRAMTPVLQGETDLLAEQLRAMQGETARTTTASLRDFSAVLAENQRQNASASTARLESIDRAGAARQKAASDALLAQLTMLENRLKNLEDSNATRLDGVRGALVQGLNVIRADNNKKLDEIRGTVEEKLQDTLQKRINDSFRTVSAQLEQVYKGLGEMQNLAADVGSLKQVLSGVKTRGILGEVQLGAILEQILAPGQYETNVATVPGSNNRVEFAVKLPGQSGTVWLPIDAKFPGDTYAHLQAAQQRGDAAATAAMRKALYSVLRQEAKDIHDKYIEVPYTTSFGILFLPFEGLYAEVVSSGVTETLQRDYQITVAGPSTMAALLNALQMGFRTLAIQKRSGEVWTVLGAVKTEFEKFGAGLQQMQRHLNQTGSDLEELIGPRSRAITRKLEAVQQLDPDTAAGLLGIQEDPKP